MSALGMHIPQLAASTLQSARRQRLRAFHVAHHAIAAGRKETLGQASAISQHAEWAGLSLMQAEVSSTPSPSRAGDCRNFGVLTSTSLTMQASLSVQSERVSP